MKAFFKSLGIVFLLLIGAIIIATISPKLGIVIGAALLLLPLAALFKPIPSLGLGHRGFSTAVAFFVGLPMTLMVIGMNAEAARYAELKRSDPVAYLAELKSVDGSKWLSEMAELDPVQYQAEIARIATEKEQREIAAREVEMARLAVEQAAAKQREIAAREVEAARQAVEQVAAEQRRAEMAAARVEAEQGKVAQHIEQLDREIASIPSTSAAKYTETVEQINVALILFGMWNLLYEQGVNLDLGPEGQKKHQRFKSLLVRKQAEMFPALRDAYGPAMRRQLWEADGSARTIGAGYRTVEFVSATFARNANIMQIHTEIQENLMMLRFTRAQYKWFKQASEYSYYDLDPPRDTDLGEWQANGRFRKVN